MSRCIVTNARPVHDRPTERILRLARRTGILRPRDLDPPGIPRESLARVVARGLLERHGRGIYVATDQAPTEHQSLLEACKRVPQGVICLLSALRFHDLTTQAPFEVWLALGPKAWRPRVD